MTGLTSPPPDPNAMGGQAGFTGQQAANLFSQFKGGNPLGSFPQGQTQVAENPGEVLSAPSAYGQGVGPQGLGIFGNDISPESDQARILAENEGETMDTVGDGMATVGNPWASRPPSGGSFGRPNNFGSPRPNAGSVKGFLPLPGISPSRHRVPAQGNPEGQNIRKQSPLGNFQSNEELRSRLRMPQFQAAR